MRRALWSVTLTLGLLVALAAYAGSIKTWTQGDTLTASDLNANFQHIHNLMVGGHGARLINSDVSASAAIAHSKLESPALLPKGIYMLSGSASMCTGYTCTQSSITQSGTAVVFTRTALGLVTGTFSVARPNAVYGVVVTAFTNSNGFCAVTSQTSTYFSLRCLSDTTPTLGNTGFNILFFDDDA